MKKAALIYDFDLTLSEEYQQFPFLREFAAEIKDKYGLSIEDYFPLLCDAKGIEYGVGAMQQVMIDAQDIFVGLTNEQMREKYGPMIKLADGLSDWFPRMNDFALNLGLDLSHHVVSAGFASLIEGTPIARYLTSIHSGTFIDDDKCIRQIATIVDPYNKMGKITQVCKGKGKENKVLRIGDYDINYDHCMVYGDGESDKNMMNFSRERGALAAGVYNGKDRDNFEKAKSSLKEHVHALVPRNFSPGSGLEEFTQWGLELIAQRTCDFDYRVVHALNVGQLKNKELLELTSRHLDNCDDCQARSAETKVYPQ